MYKFNIDDFTLLGDRLLIELDPELEKLIITPHKSIQDIVTGVVVSAGRESGIGKGNRVFFSAMVQENAMPFQVGEKTYLMINSMSVIGSLPAEQTYV